MVFMGVAMEAPTWLPSHKTKGACPIAHERACSTRLSRGIQTRKGVTECKQSHRKTASRGNNAELSIQSASTAAAGSSKHQPEKSSGVWLGSCRYLHCAGS